MKPNLKLLLAVAAAVGSTVAVAQDDQQPPPAPPILALAAAETPPPAKPAADAPAPATPAPAAPAAPAAPTPAPAAATPPPAHGHPPGERYWLWRHRQNQDGAPGQNEGQRPPDGQKPEDGQHREHFHHPDGAAPEGWREGNRGPDGAEGPGHFQHPPLPPPKPAPFIGVITAPVPPILAAQLGLPENFGLVVEGVIPNSPAATAGLQRFDVLKLYNDQQIVDPRQLQILVRATGKDGSATLTVIRQAKEEKITVKIGEHVFTSAAHGFHHPDGAEQGAGHQRFAQAGGEHAGEHHPAEQPGEKPQTGPAHQEFDHQRFAGHDGEQHGPEQQRLSRNGFEHHGFDRGESRHQGFDHHGFGREGAERQSSRHHGFSHRGFGGEGFEGQSSRHHGFGHHGFGREGFGRQSSRHHGFGHHGFGREGFGHQSSRHHGFGHHGFGREGFDGQGSRHHGFGHHHGFGREGFGRESSHHHGFHHRGSGHERFAHRGERQNDGDRRHSEHGPAQDGRDQSGGEHHHAPLDRSGRQPSPNGGPDNENRHRDFQNRPGERHHRSSDAQPPADLPPVEPANLLREIRPGGAAQIRVEHADGSVVYDTANARVMLTDDAGKIVIAVKDGHRTLLATDTRGDTVFEGPIETPEQLTSVPEDIRKKIEWIESRTQTELVDAPAPANTLIQ